MESRQADVAVVNEHVDKVLASLQEAKYQTPLSGDELSALFQSFYDKIEEDLHSKYSRKQASRIADAIERSLCSTLHDKLFEPASDSCRVQRFDERLRELRRSEALLDKLELDISSKLRPQLEPTIAYLSTIERAKVPQEKVYCISQVNKMIVDVLKDTASGDVILPLLIYCILACPVTSLWRHSSYARRFRRQSAVKGQASYCLTNFEAAIYFLETFSIDDPPPDVDPALFRSPSRSNSDARLDRSRSNSIASESRSRSNSLTPIRSRIGTMGASVGASVSKYLFTKVQQSAPGTIAEIRQKLESDSLSVSTGEEAYINQKFMTADADNLTIADVKQLLADYKRLANHVNGC